MDPIFAPVPSVECQLNRKMQPFSSLSRSHFALGTFHIQSYTIRLSFDQIKGFKVRVSNHNQVISNTYVDLVAPFCCYRNITREKLHLLSSQLPAGYNVRVVKTDERFRV